jgi:nicotinate dehydrogenase large molybdopterin subunit
MTAAEYIVARDPADAVAARRALGPAARYIAGGTALQLAWPEGRADHALIDVAGIDMGPAVSIISGERRAPALRLAATAVLEDVRRDPAVRTHAPILATALSDIAGLGVRHLATVGGNLAWRSGDLVPLLLVLDARIVAAERGMVAVADWIALHHGDPENGDLVLAVDIPLPVPQPVMWEKIGRRAAFSPSLITVAAAFAARDAHAADCIRMAVGGGPVPPMRLSASEARIGGARRDASELASLVAALGAEIRAPDDPAATGAYRAGAASRVLAAFLVDAHDTAGEAKP